MKILYYIYQLCIALPILLVLTIVTALVTIIGSLLGGAHFWGYYPGKIWSQLVCLFLLIPVKIRGLADHRDSSRYYHWLSVGRSTFLGLLSRENLVAAGMSFPADSR